MKAWTIQGSFGIDSLTLIERDEPHAGARQVLIRVRAVSLNYRDLMVTKGAYNPRQKLPLVPCSDGAGEVVAVGDEVKDFKVGDRVASCFFQNWIDGEMTDAQARTSLGSPADGMLREYAVLEESGVVHTPAHLTDEEAACLPCAGLAAWNALVEASHTKAGDSVLVQGTGGVSIFALQFAKMMGASVIATSSSDEKLARVREMGAVNVVNYKQTPEWGKSVRELTGGKGVDAIVEVGGAGTLAQSFTAVRRGGTIALIGVLSGTGEVNPTPVLMNGLRMQGIYVGSRRMFEDMNRASSLHEMRPVVDRVFAMDEAREALGFMESGNHFGKIVIRVS
ncbi:MAG: NAD(P)-dependent alcohol dehydrogenase [Pyrinomonadaceae bacterium MAG19_C2-C3]|nr:NAD(P)-dependent alcohol dehydrogenase [Pyrinomonadaceae bacterium MAG19_C2-C3]